MTTTTALALGLCALAALPAGAADWSDTFLGYRNGKSFHEPTNPLAIEKNIISITHASRYALGSNFLNVDTFMSDGTDPSAGTGPQGGAHEIYIAYRHHLSFSKLFSANLKAGPLKDLSFTAGFDLNSKNSGLAPRKRVIVAGPTFNLAVPKGFLDLGIWYYKEKNHNAFGTVTKQIDFDGALMGNLTWGIPVTLGPVATNFKGFVNYIGSKGKDAKGIPTAPETLVRTSWMFDIGALLSSHKGAILVGPGYEYWNNKFGNQSPVPVSPTSTATLPNIKTSTFLAQLEIHF